MSTTATATMGDRGRLVVPAGVRERQGWDTSTTLVFIESPDGVVVVTRDQLRRVVARQLQGGEPGRRAAGGSSSRGDAGRMMVIDASALLAFLQDEAGAEVVEKNLSGSVTSAANWSEVTQKVLARGADWALVSALLSSHGLQVADVTRDDAEQAAHLGSQNPSLSLGDRLGHALGERLEVPVLTADRAWGASEQILQIR